MNDVLIIRIDNNQLHKYQMEICKTKGENKGAFYSTKFDNLESLKEGLFNLENKKDFSHLSVSLDEFNETILLKNGFSFDKDYPRIIDMSEKLKDSFFFKIRSIKKDLDELYLESEYWDIKGVYFGLKKILGKYYTLLSNLIDFEEVTTEEEFLEKSIDIYNYLFCQIYEILYVKDVYPATLFDKGIGQLLLFCKATIRGGENFNLVLNEHGYEKQNVLN